MSWLGTVMAAFWQRALVGCRIFTTEHCRIRLKAFMLVRTTRRRARMRRTSGTTIVLAGLLLLGATHPVQADNGLAGTWTIVRAEPAPWIDGKTYLPNRAAMPSYVGKRVIFAADRIEGPELLACTKPNYVIVEVPAPGLFQGMLDTAESSGGKPAESVATSLGFATRPIRTLQTSCLHPIDYHMSDANNAAFALDNMIYWLKRDGTP